MADPPKKVARQAARQKVINRLILPAKVLGDWVIEPEVPAASRKMDAFFASSEYQSWKKRRHCFVDDYVEIWAIIKKRTLSSSAEIYIDTVEVDPIDDDELHTLTNAKPTKGKVRNRPMEMVTNIHNKPWRDVHRKILVEVDSAKRRTFIRTGYQLPEDSSERTEDHEFQFSLRVKDGGETIRFESPELTARGWWVPRLFNQGFVKQRAHKIKPLVDGVDYFLECLSAIDSATSKIHLASWSFEVNTPLNAAGRTVKQALADAAARGVTIRILLDHFNAGWATGPARLIHASVQVRKAVHPKTFFGKQLGSYHDKSLCVDGKIGFLGGIDFMPNRINDPKHDAKLAILPASTILWHDAGVRFEGDAVSDLEFSFLSRWNESGGPKVKRPRMRFGRNGVSVQIVRTQDPSTYPYPIKGTWHAYKAAIHSARHYIYMENQYYYYEPLGSVIRKAMDERPELQVIMVMPFITEEMMVTNAAAFRNNPGYIWDGIDEADIKARAYLHGTYLQNRIVRKMRGASNSANRFGLYALGTCYLGKQEMIYPHSKLMIVDDTWAIIGSANANGRGFVTDGEINLIIHRRGVVTKFRRALWKEHLKVDLPTRKIRDFAAEWKSRSLPKVKKPDDHSCADLLAKRVCKIEPPKGVEYDGPLDWTGMIDDLV